MTDDTTKELKVEVPKHFDAKEEGINAVVFGIQQAVSKFIQSYDTHSTRQSRELVVSVPNIVLRENQQEKEFPLSDVVEDTNTDK